MNHLDETTKIGRVNVPVRFFKYPSIVDFHSGDHGRFERGYYFFWSAVIDKKPIGRRVIIGRARAVLPPGDRFHRIYMESKTCNDAEDRKAYSRIWRAMGGGKKVLYVRPSSLKEIKRWINTHESDAKHIRSVKISGKSVKWK